MGDGCTFEVKQYLILTSSSSATASPSARREDVGTFVEEDVQALDEQLDEELRPAA
jgi:hypothetical protein